MSVPAATATPGAPALRGDDSAPARTDTGPQPNGVPPRLLHSLPSSARRPGNCRARPPADPATWPDPVRLIGALRSPPAPDNSSHGRVGRPVPPHVPSD